MGKRRNNRRGKQLMVPRRYPGSVGMIEFSFAVNQAAAASPLSVTATNFNMDTSRAFRVRRATFQYSGSTSAGVNNNAQISIADETGKSIAVGEPTLVGTNNRQCSVVNLPNNGYQQYLGNGAVVYLHYGGTSYNAGIFKIWVDISRPTLFP